MFRRENMKNRFYKVAFLTSLALGQLSYAEIRQITNMSEIRPEIDTHTLVIFDIDNTILEPVQTLGSDQWYGSLVKENLELGLTEDAAIDAAIHLWVDVQNKTKVKAVEASTPALIEELQKAGIQVMALTSRPLNLIDATVKQLQSLGVDLSKTSGLADDLEIPAADKTKTKAGIIFVGPKNNKGLVLGKYIESLTDKPRKIVFSDDKQKHVTNVETALSPLNIPYVGFRYGAADAEVASFNKDISNLQLKYFLNILSNEEAEKMLRDM